MTRPPLVPPGVVPGSVVPGFLDDGHWSACFGLSYLELTLYDLQGPRQVMNERATYLRKVAGTGGIPDGRNDVVRSFLDRSAGEWLWFIDTDMGFAPDTVERLVAAADRLERPVVGGLCFAQRRTGAGPLHAERFGIIPTLYTWVDLDPADSGTAAAESGFMPIADYPRDQVVTVGATGAACLLIHRRILDQMRTKHGDEWFDPITHPTALAGKPRTFSEDLSFCVRVAGLDEPIHVDTGVKTCHEKGGIFLDEDLYTAQQQASAGCDQPAASPAA